MYMNIQFVQLLVFYCCKACSLFEGGPSRGPMLGATSGQEGIKVTFAYYKQSKYSIEVLCLVFPLLCHIPNTHVCTHVL